jgi:hypothetical protein
MFRSLLGEDVLDNLVLGTTKWGLHVPNSDLRHDQLVTDYWKPLLDDGAEAFRIEDTASAWKLIERIISPRTKQSERRDMLILCVSFLFVLKVSKIYFQIQCHGRHRCREKHCAYARNGRDFSVTDLLLH